MEKDELPEAMKPAAEAVERLHKIFQDPHPGLHIWLEFLLRATRDAYVELHKCGTGDDAEVKRRLGL
jgi:hypothetical protein